MWKILQSISHHAGMACLHMRDRHYSYILIVSNKLGDYANIGIFYKNASKLVQSRQEGAYGYNDWYAADCSGMCRSTYH